MADNTLYGAKFVGCKLERRAGCPCVHSALSASINDCCVIKVTAGTNDFGGGTGIIIEANVLILSAANVLKKERILPND